MAKSKLTATAANHTVHLSMSCDGNPSADVAQAGLSQAETIIDGVATKATA